MLEIKNSLLNGQERVKFKVGDLIILKDSENMSEAFLPLLEEDVGAMCLVESEPENAQNPFYKCRSVESDGRIIRALEEEMELVN